MNERISALKTLKHRAEEYCSTSQLKETEFEFLKETFLSNGFPLHTIEHILHNPSSKHFPGEDQQNPVDYSKSFMVPYYPAANALIKKLKKRFNISTVFTKTETLGNFLKKKTHQPIEPMKRKGAIYAYPCEENVQFSILGKLRVLLVQESRRKELHASKQPKTKSSK